MPIQIYTIGRSIWFIQFEWYTAQSALYKIKLICWPFNISSFGKQDSEALSGAKGYAAPEANGSGTDIIKADIYSFGVILLVLLTGQKAFDRYVITCTCATSSLVYWRIIVFFSSRGPNDQFLVDWASPHLHDLNSLGRITDPRIRGSMPPKAISALGNIILLCIKVVFRPPFWYILFCSFLSLLAAIKVKTQILPMLLW